MKNRMSLTSRIELMQSVHERYHQATWKEKTKILDEFIATTGLSSPQFIIQI